MPTLDPLLFLRRQSLLPLTVAGVVNGIDYTEWHPASDPHLQRDGYANYDLDSLTEGKARCKAALQKVGWAPGPDSYPDRGCGCHPMPCVIAPLVGM